AFQSGFEESGQTFRVDLYEAARRSELGVYFADGQKFLYLRAIVVDTIATASTPCSIDPDRTIRKTWYDRVKRTFEYWSTTAPPTVHLDEDSFWRTLIADRSDQSFPAPPAWKHYHRIFDECLTLWPQLLSSERLIHWGERIDPEIQAGRKTLKSFNPVLSAAVS
ncbi:hypothetical protein LTR17_027894, partial [Elasticomyces elasticus]